MEKRKVECEHKDRPNYAKGLCKTCWTRWKYNSDPVRRERIQQQHRVYSKNWAKKKYEKDPLFYQKKSLEYRNKYPDKFRFIQARSLFRKMSPIYKKKFIDEINLSENTEKK